VRARLTAIATLALLLAAAAFFFLHKREHWAVYYADALPPEAFMAYDLLVFDSDIHPPLASLKAQGKTLLGYLSLAEADPYRSYYPAMKDWLLPKETGRPEYIDVRRPEWKTYVVETLVPAILAQGFDGIMIDTVDSATTLEAQHAGMSDGAAAIIREIRARFPHMLIMLNRGFAILPQVADSIDMVMAESIYAGWRMGSRDAAPVAAETYADYVAMLADIKRRFPHVKIYTLDYWPPGDEESIARIYKMQRRQGFIPYVSSDQSLRILTKEPR
jgi:uncharacterized protein (TIGR01370 family)